MEERDRLHDTAITFAAKNGALECIKLLVSRGADLSARDQEGSTILLASLINGYAPIVSYLLRERTHPPPPNRFSTIWEIFVLFFVFFLHYGFLVSGD